MQKHSRYPLLILPLLLVGTGGCAVEFGGDDTSPTEPAFPTFPPTPEPTTPPEVTESPTPEITPEPTAIPDPTPVTYYFQATGVGDFLTLGGAIYTVDRRSDGSESLSGWTALDYDEYGDLPFKSNTTTTAELDGDGRLVHANINQNIEVGETQFNRIFEVDGVNQTILIHRDDHTVEWALTDQDLGPMALWSWESDPHFRYAVPDVGMAYIASRAANILRDPPSLLIPDFYDRSQTFNDVGGCFTFNERICADDPNPTDNFITSISLSDMNTSIERIRNTFEYDAPATIEAGGETITVGDCSLDDYITREDRVSRGGLPTLAIEYNLPQGDGPFPIVTFISDFGGADRDWSRYGMPVSKCLAQSLLAQGFGVARWDERGFGESGGAVDDTTFTDRSTDLLDIYTHISQQDFAIPSQISLVGHGEGVLHALDLMDGQANFAALVSAGAFSGASDAFWKARSEGYLAEIEMPEAFETAYIEELEAALIAIENRTYLENGYQGLSLLFWEELLAFDVNGAWAQNSIPTLLLYGEKDWETSADHGDTISALLSAAGNSAVELEKFENLGHRFSAAPAGENLGREYYLPYAWDPAVTAEILTFLDTHGR